MSRPLQIAWSLTVCLAAVAVARAQEPAAPKPKVEFRWLAATPAKGVTEEKGIQTTCGPELLYPHLRPVLDAADVAGAASREYDLGNLGVQHLVEFRLTDAARAKLVKAAGDRPLMELAVFVDGRYRSAWYFRKAEAASFAPVAGSFTKAEAGRVVAAFR